MELSPEQREAIMHLNGHTLVIAGPGSGKTHTQAEKCRFLMQQFPAEPVVAVTFTRDAAQELRSRILKGLRRSPKTLSVGTYHVLAIKQLRRVGKMTAMRLLSTSEQKAVLHRAWMPLSSSITWDEAVEAVDRYKSSLDPTIRDAPDGWVYRRYQEFLLVHPSLDYSDLLLNAVRGMRDGSICPLPARHILGDEIQDQDSIQFEWLEHHIRSGAMATLVGDDDQCIYGFRRALGYRGMTRFENDYSARRIVLNINYRSAQSIVSASDRLIRHNTERMDKNLIAHHNMAGRVEYRNYASRKEEAAAVAATVTETPDSWAVFARTVRILDVVESALLKSGIPYIRVGARRLWEKPHLGNMLSILRTLVTGEAMGYEYLLSWSGLNDEDISRLRPLTVAKISEARNFFPKNSREVIDNLTQRLTEWNEELRTPMPRPGLVIQGVGDWLVSVAKVDIYAEDFMLAADTLAGYTGTLPERLHTVQFQRKNSRRKGVSLLTLHGAKGLEFPSVFMIGVEEKILPYNQSPIPDERRLAYVGMTRAKERLILSTGLATAVPSRFLVEAGLLTAKGAA
ncbi:MAG: ATP-dependent helicase [Sulfuricaulis sp.]